MKFIINLHFYIKYHFLIYYKYNHIIFQDHLIISISCNCMDILQHLHLKTEFQGVSDNCVVG